ncbi:MAG: sensor histidine kinase [Deltaproteobacteria bacterium]|nr:sensor histidine kinase [Deltaproteobacteria bacterium]
MRVAVVLVLAASVVALVSRGYAEETVALGTVETPHALGAAVGLLEDPGRAWTIADVASPAFESRFAPSPGDGFNAGLTRSAWWLRIRVRAPEGAGDERWLVELPWAVVDRVDRFVPDGVGGFAVASAGESVPFGAWEIAHRTPVFTLPTRPGETTTCYLRVAGDDTMLLSPVLWSTRTFAATETTASLGYGFYYGALFALVLYNLIQFLAIRDVVYLLYVATIAGFAFYQLCLDGFAYQYLWPGAPGWALRSLHFFAAVSGVGSALFSRRFLVTWQYLPTLDRWLRRAGWPVAALLVACLVLSIPAMIRVVGVVIVACAFTFLPAAVVAWRRGYRAARFYLLAWGGIGLAVVVHAARGFGLVPGSWVATHAMQLGVFSTALTLALVLADRVQLLQGALAESLQDKERLLGELERRSAEVEAANRHKSEFLAHMSHELRTPLNAVIGFSRVLLRRVFGGLSDKQAEYLQDIHGSGQHLLSLIDDILDLSRIEAGRLELEPAPFDLGAAIEQSLLLVRERAARGEIRLVTDIDPTLGEWVGDARKARQILINLLANAVKFTPAGGTVTVRARRDADAAVIAVSDDGIGIAAEDQTRVFEPFQQAGRRDGRREGTGLGLALVQRLVELHGGRVTLASAVGRGSTFTVTLPAVGAVLAGGTPATAVAAEPLSGTREDALVQRWRTSGS